MTPETVLYILGKLGKAGFKSYLVGGCVRDMILGREPHDWDITTQATPEQIKEVFKDSRVVPTGEKFGTITVIIDNKPYEITTMRKEGSYSDGRRPDSVEYTLNIEEDLARRDFTMNAIAFNSITMEYIDPFDGRVDIINKTIKAVGNAKDRIYEDGLRIMRAYRFAAQLGFSINPELEAAINDSQPYIKNIAVERIQQELMKLLEGEFAFNSLTQIFESNLARFIFPDDLVAGWTWDQKTEYHDKTVTGHCIDAVRHIPSDKPLLRLTTLLHDVGKPRCHYKDPKTGKWHAIGHEKIGAELARLWMEKMNFSTNDIEYVTHLIRVHMLGHARRKKPAAFKRLILKIGKKYLRDSFALNKADILSGSPQKAEKHLKWFLKQKSICFRMEPFLIESSQELEICGNNIMNILDLKPGPQVGEILEKCVDIINNQGMNGKKVNNREYLKRFVENMRGKI